MPVSFKVSSEDYETITKIVARAVAAGFDPLSTSMDVTATHAATPLRLQELLEADDINFFHDLAGIRRHLNRETGEMEDCFVPRFARRFVTALLAFAFLSLPSFAAEPCRINVNTSNVSEIQLFARTGNVLAARIAVGQPYKTLEQLDAVKGIGESWMAANGPHVAFAGTTTCTEKIKAPKPVASPKL